MKAKDSEVWVNHPWGGNKQVVKSSKTKLSNLPTWLNAIIGILILIAASTLVWFLISALS